MCLPSSLLSLSGTGDYDECNHLISMYVFSKEIPGSHEFRWQGLRTIENAARVLGSSLGGAQSTRLVVLDLAEWLEQLVELDLIKCRTMPCEVTVGELVQGARTMCKKYTTNKELSKTSGMRYLEIRMTDADELFAQQPIKFKVDFQAVCWKTAYAASMFSLLFPMDISAMDTGHTIEAETVKYGWGK
eukprot:GHVU01158411.1.p1 GENE.GHVU01158411.1~~GHVU01158411.1.p1  ORF type:complete len:188 (+),score=25.31 GHVU01158411.1:1697-2260(+)